MIETPATRAFLASRDALNRRTAQSARPKLANLWLVVTLAFSMRALAADGVDVFPPAPQRELVVRTCAACHQPEIVVVKRHTPDEWDDIIAKMIDRGAMATDEEQQQILEYLSKFFGPA